MANAAVTTRDQEITDGQMIEFFRLKKAGKRTRREMDAFLAGKNPFPILTNPLDQWTQFYAEVFGRKVDFSGVKVPDNPGDFNQVIYMAKGLSYNQVEEACKNADKFWKYSDKPLSELVDMNNEARTTESGSYAIRVRNTEEADAVHQSKSADDLGQEGIKGQTLLERLVHGLFYYWLNKQRRLDFTNWTLCAGSRLHDGRVPRAGFDPDGRSVDVHWYDPHDRYSGLRVREVVMV